MKIKELKIAIYSLEKEKLYGSLYKELIKKLIDIYEIEDNKSALSFWKRKIENYV